MGTYSATKPRPMLPPPKWMAFFSGAILLSVFLAGIGVCTAAAGGGVALGGFAWSVGAADGAAAACFGFRPSSFLKKLDALRRKAEGAATIACGAQNKALRG